MKTHPSLKPVLTKNANPPSGHYSQAIVAGGTIYVSGQLGTEPGQDKSRPGTAAEQTRNCIQGISEILKAAGSDLSKVVKVTVFISDKEHWGEVNKAIAEAFDEHRPARSIIPCGDMYFGYALEMEVIAVQ